MSEAPRNRRLACLILGWALVVGGLAPSAGAQVGDVTAPVITRELTGSAGEGGWFVGPVNVRWRIQEPDSLWSSAGCDARAFAADTAGVALECRVVSEGGSTSNGITVRIDSTPPAVTAALPARPPDHDGWYTRPVPVAFSGTDTLSGLASCSATTYAGPDAAGASVAGTCRDRAGNASPPLAFALAYDATGPEILDGRASRRPDRRGWYDHPVRVRFRARDEVSGGATCTPITYRGPDGPDAAVQAACTDRAGNATVQAFPLRYDATPPSLALRVTPGDRFNLLEWDAAPDTHGVVVTRRLVGRPGTRRVVYRGRRARHVDTGLASGRRYAYAITAVDRAGNRTRRTGGARTGRRLLEPDRGARVLAPPLLRWTPVSGAQYYNVQLFRGRTRILTAWPEQAELQLPTAWTFDGRPESLAPDTYRWYVWPARGRREAPRYGARMGPGRFAVGAR